jgi:hypothetical protein
LKKFATLGEIDEQLPLLLLPILDSAKVLPPIHHTPDIRVRRFPSFEADPENRASG